MKNKILIAVSVIAALLIAGGAYYYYKAVNVKPSSVYLSVPESASVILEFRDFHGAWERFENNDRLFMEFANLSFFKKMKADVSFFDSLFIFNADIRKVFDKQPIVVSWHVAGADDFNSLYSIGLPAVNLQSDVDQFVSSVYGSNADISEKLFNEIVIKHIKNKKANTSFYYATHEGILFGSSSSSLVEDAIRQIGLKRSFLDNLAFKQIYSTAGGKVDANIFINFSFIPRFLSIFLKPDFAETADMFARLASWAELDLNVKDHGLMFNGFTHVNDSDYNHLQLFLPQQPQENQFISVLPSNTSAFLFFGLNNVLSFYLDYKAEREKQGNTDNYETDVQRINTEYDVNIEVSMLSWIGSEMGIVFVESDSTSLKKNSYAVFKAADISQAPALLDDLFYKLSKKNPAATKKETYNDITICNITIPDVMSKVFGPTFDYMDFSCYAILGDYIVFGYDVVSLKKYIDYYVSEKTLNRNYEFGVFSENLSSASNVYFYLNIPKSLDILDLYGNEKSANTLKNNEGSLKKFEAFALQMSSNKESFYNNVYLKFNPDYQTNSKTTWEIRLDTSVSSKSSIVTNFYSKEDEVFVQDDANVIYLANKVGKTLWKRPLPEKIISEIYQADIFNNGKLQFVFNTRDFLFMVDRNGNDVAPFPIELDAPASAGLALFDYENNKDYRIIIPAKNNHVYNYKKDGTLVKGWVFDKSEGIIHQPFQYMAVAGKDYLFANDDQGKVYIIDRTGKARTEVKERIKFSKGSKLNLIKGNSAATTRLIITDSKGSIYTIHLDGTFENFSVKEFSDQHSFEVGDLNKDGVLEFIFSERNELTVYDETKKLLFKHSFENDIRTRPQLIPFPDKSDKIGLAETGLDLFYLFNMDGSQYKGFPVKGISAAGFSKDAKEKEMMISVSVPENMVVIYNPE